MTGIIASLRNTFNLNIGVIIILSNKRNILTKRPSVLVDFPARSRRKRRVAYELGFDNQVVAGVVFILLYFTMKFYEGVLSFFK